MGVRSVVICLKRTFFTIALALPCLASCHNSSGVIVLINGEKRLPLILVPDDISQSDLGTYVTSQYLSFKRIELEDYANGTIDVSISNLPSGYTLFSDVFINHPDYSIVYNYHLNSFYYDYQNGRYIAKTSLTKLDKKMVAFQYFILQRDNSYYYFGINYGYPVLDNQKASSLIVEPSDISSVYYCDMENTSYEDDQSIIKEETLNDESIKTAYKSIFDSYSILSYDGIPNYDGSVYRKPGERALEIEITTKTLDKVNFLLSSFNLNERYNTSTIIEINNKDYLFYSPKLFDFFKMLNL